MLPKFLLLPQVYFSDQNNKDQKYKKTVISHYMTLYSPDNYYFRVTMKLLIAQLHSTDFLKASSVKVQDIMLMPAYISWNYADLRRAFLEIFMIYLKKTRSLYAKTCQTLCNQDNWILRC